MICSKCKNEGTGKFCGKCGTKMPVDKNVIDPNIRRIDIFLKLGVFMVLIAGLILATSNYEFIADPIKVLLLSFISLLFFGLTAVSALFIKIKSTTKSYLLIAFLFSIFAIVGTAYYELVGDWFAFNEDNFDVVLTTIFSINTIYMLIYDLVFKSRFAKVFGSITFFLVSIFLFILFDAEASTMLLVLSIFYFLIHMICPRKGYFYGISVVGNYLFFIMAFIAYVGMSFDTCVAVSAVITLLNTLLFTVKDKRKLFVVLNVIASYMIAFATAMLFNNAIVRFDSITVALILFVYLYYYLVAKIFNLKNDEIIFKANHIIGLLAALWVVTFNLSNDSITQLLSCFNLFIINLLNGIGSKTEFYDYLRPITLIFVIIASLIVMNDYLFTITFGSALVIIAAFLLINHFIERKVGIKAIAISLSTCVLFYTVLYNMSKYSYTTSDAIIQLFGLLVCYVLYLYSSFNNKNSGYKVLRVFALIIYILLLSSLFLKTGLFNIPLYIGSLICFFITLFNYALPFKNRFNKYFLAIYSLIPFASFIGDVNLSSEVTGLIVNVYYIIALFMLILPLGKKQSLLKHVLFIIFVTFIIIIDIFASGIWLSIFAGVVSLSLIIYSLIQKKYTVAYFIIGVITTVLNLIWALKDVWSEVPLWLYLLLGGLLVIILCTVLLIKEVSKKQD